MTLAVLVLVLALVLCSPGEKSGKASDFYVRELPDVEPDVVLPEMHAGLLEAGTQSGLPEASLFFWHIRSKIDTQTTIIWFNGGPGCSSMDGNFLEIGPLRFNDKGRLTNAPDGSWAEQANLLFLDQPFGTGYSDPDGDVYSSSLEEAADAVVAFLNSYADIFPEVAATDIYLAGESFAGQYIPYIYQSLTRHPEVVQKIGAIKGLIMGNPWIDPSNQYLSYGPLIKNEGIIPQKDWAKLDALQENCMTALSRPGGTDRIYVDECELIPQHALQTHGDNSHCFNIYKYTSESVYPMCGMEWPAEVPQMTSYLGRGDVQKALNVNNGTEAETWKECSSAVHSHFSKSIQIPSVKLLPDILQEIPILLLIGDLDFICNGLGIDRFVHNLVFNGHTGFEQKETITSYGRFQNERNLCVAHVTNGSHMVPVDELLVSQKLVYSFVNASKGLDYTYDFDDHNSGNTNTTNSDDGKSSQSGNTQVENRSYKKASIVALVIIVVVLLVVLTAWLHEGKGLSPREIFHAAMHSNFRPAKTTRFEDISLDSVRRPLNGPILEEDEFEV
ncbi:serine-type carboxypeptidase [Starmerella bacillaris]|uniref:Pheromone-processing carboxypeptidase KEX1 n=1 Tax=Starmerella bacillaris TaxID=1247836 RepID=A0AAV5RFU9_STABA|nr:serine-type carboxypeptidase [Starmerella bacillaris]